MHVIISATNQEVYKLTKESKALNRNDTVFQYSSKVHIIISGIGIVNTTIALFQYIGQFGKPQSITNLGICGSFLQKYLPGTIVQIDTDIFADNIIEDREAYLFWNSHSIKKQKPPELKPIRPAFANKLNIPRARGITSNRISGKKSTIQERIGLFQPDTESMEGAAVFNLATKYKIPTVQIRAISNFIEPRNKINWQITNATDQLNSFALQNILPHLDKY